MAQEEIFVELAVERPTAFHHIDELCNLEKWYEDSVWSYSQSNAHYELLQNCVKKLPLIENTKLS